MDGRTEARMFLQSQREIYAEEYRKGRKRGNTRLGAALYAYGYSRLIGWPWAGLRILWRARP